MAFSPTISAMKKVVKIGILEVEALAGTLSTFFIMSRDSFKVLLTLLHTLCLEVEGVEMEIFLYNSEREGYKL